jgi:transposase
MTAGQM